MIATVKIDTTGAERKLAQLQQRINKLPWRQAGEIVKQSIQASFETGGNYSTVGSPLAGRNKWSPRKKVVAWKILKKSSALQKSIYVYPVNNRSYIGSRGLDYNRAHNLGYGAIPARPFLVVKDADIRAISTLFRNYLTIR